MPCLNKSNINHYLTTTNKIIKAKRSTVLASLVETTYPDKRLSNILNYPFFLQLLQAPVLHNAKRMSSG